jgi:hypothetical protein
LAELYGREAKASVGGVLAEIHGEDLDAALRAD